MKPLLVFINIAGPMKNPEVKDSLVHQIELGVQRKGSDKPDQVRMVMPTANTCEALDMAVTSLKACIEKYYPQPKSKPPTPEHVMNIHD